MIAGASVETLCRRANYGGRKGARAMRRLHRHHAFEYYAIVSLDAPEPFALHECDPDETA